MFHCHATQFLPAQDEPQRMDEQEYIGYNSGSRDTDPDQMEEGVNLPDNFGTGSGDSTQPSQMSNTINDGGLITAETSTSGIALAFPNFPVSQFPNLPISQLLAQPFPNLPVSQFTNFPTFGPGISQFTSFPISQFPNFPTLGPGISQFTSFPIFQLLAQAFPNLPISQRFFQLFKNIPVFQIPDSYIATSSTLQTFL